MSVAAVILAAGFSRRLGRSKQTLVIAGETLLQRAVRTAREAGLTPIIVVVNSQAKVQVDGCILVINEQAAEGMAASIRAGIAVAQDHAVDGALLMTCDQVAVTPEHLRALCLVPTTITASAYGGKKGVPAYFPLSQFDDLLQLQGDAGARSLLREADAIIDENLNFDIDTEEDFAKAQQHFAS